MAASPPSLPAAVVPTKLDASPMSPPKSPPLNMGRPISPGPQLLDDQKDIKMSTLGGDPAGPTCASLVSDAPTWTMSTKEEWVAIAACLWCVFSVGWNDATTGPLLPSIQAHYGINFIIVSMLFVSNCVGFLSAAVINIRLTDRLGFGKLILIGAMFQVLAYSLMIPALPFPVMCVAYAINGLGIGFQDAQVNGFIADLPNNASAKMGLLHAVYGAGAFLSPLVATQFAQLPRWSFHYLTSLGLSVTNAAVLFIVFKLRTQREVMGLPSSKSTLDYTEEHQNSSSGGKYKEIFTSRAVQLVAFFIWLYVGVEVTIGGWIVTFLIDERGGGASVGYVSSGFFGGLMLGRVVLLWVNEKIGERRVIYVYCILCIGLELVVWLVPNLLGNAIAVSFGMSPSSTREQIILPVNRPMYPIAMNVTGAIVPKRILTESIGWIASFGQAGSAVFPFMTGALAEKHSAKVLQPLAVGMIGALVVLWTLVPAGPKRGKGSTEPKSATNA
ncbi:Glucose/mannose transporter GlcP [Rhizoctonia solani]|uniref:Glucose/mannose transporter GlcP n=1 Tax=Rhizoctonia solani TaxID=456999 RepID=A0A0K6FV17_9AGAM|nr:Glucose/mannose transporter GlcP [Rhizoctonia solani]